MARINISETEPFVIPANYTDSGKLAGYVEVRNAVEAVILLFLVGGSLIKFVHVSLMAKICICIIVLIPLVVLALFGIDGDTLFERGAYMIRFVFRRRKLHFRRVGYKYAKESIRKPRKPVGRFQRFIQEIGF